jgi:hypothetical protein
MGRAVLQSCWPWIAWWVGSCGLLWLLARAGRARLRWGRLRRLHGDQRGTAQSLSFVLVLPLFIFVIMFIVQVSQLWIAEMVVHYSAFAGARAASVWIPARLAGGVETENCVAAYALAAESPEQPPPITDPTDPGFGPADNAASGEYYRIAETGQKYEKIRSAVVLALVPVSPSRDLGFDPPGAAMTTWDILDRAYQSMAPPPLFGKGPPRSGAITRRLRNKLAYAANNTAVEVRFFHSRAEPYLANWRFLDPYRYHPEDDLYEFRENELGWQDHVTVTVHYNLALLPGPGRLLFRTRQRDTGPQTISPQTGGRAGASFTYYVYPLVGSFTTGRQSATLGNEGEKSVLPYVYSSF